ncbi:MAG: hypothetical protein ACRDV3_06085 [Acidothermaceae bacterium]
MASTVWNVKRSNAPSGEPVESLASRLYDDVTVTEVIRPAAVLSERNAKRVLDGLLADDVRSGGRWHAEPGCWRLFERPWKGRDERSAAAAGLIGSIQVAYGMPTRYEITIFRATVTLAGTRAGYTVESLCDAALDYADLTLATCPRIDLQPPPKPFRMPGPS